MAQVVDQRAELLRASRAARGMRRSRRTPARTPPRTGSALARRRCRPASRASSRRCRASASSTARTNAGSSSSLAMRRRYATMSLISARSNIDWPPDISYGMSARAAPSRTRAPGGCRGRGSRSRRTSRAARSAAPRSPRRPVSRLRLVVGAGATRIVSPCPSSLHSLLSKSFGLLAISAFAERRMRTRRAVVLLELDHLQRRDSRAAGARGCRASRRASRRSPGRRRRRR